MHELSVAATILETAIQKAGGMGRIDDIHLKMGCLMMLNVDQLKFGFEILARGTIAQHAGLHIEIAKARLRCAGGHETRVEVRELSIDHLLPVIKCGVCDAPTEILEGRELVLTRIVGE